MKLSTAIKRGAALHEQAFGDFITNWHSPDGKDGWLNEAGLCTCALGAAYEAVTGLLPFDDPYELVEVEDDPRLRRLLRRLKNVEEEPGQSFIEATLQVYCNVKHDRDYVDLPDAWGRRGIFSAISILNDQLCWSREAIATYIAKQGF